MSTFLESPWPTVMLGLALEAILAIVLVQIRRPTVVALMIGVLAITVGVLVVERIVVTENEDVEDMLDGLAGALVSNDAARTMAMFTADSPRRNEVEAILGRVTIRDARVGGDLEIRLNKLTIPPSATTYFTGRIDAKDNRGTIPYEHLIRRFKVTLHRYNGRWQLYDYAEADRPKK